MIHTVHRISPIAKMTWTTTNILKKSELQLSGCSEYDKCNFLNTQVKSPFMVLQEILGGGEFRKKKKKRFVFSKLYNTQ